jgi:hypothetical protein
VSRLSVSLSRLLQGGYFLELIENIVMKVIWRIPPFLLYYDRFIIMSYDFATPAFCARRLKSIRTRIAGIADLPALNRFMDKGERYANRFGKGDIAIVAELHDEIVGMVWIEIGNGHYEEEYEYRFPYPERSAWQYDGYISPDYRVMGVWASIADEVVRHLGQRSLPTVYCIVQGLNRLSINSHLRYGYRARRQVVFVRFLFLRIYLEKNLDQTAGNNGWRAAFAFRKLRWYRGSLNT